MARGPLTPLQRQKITQLRDAHDSLTLARKNIKRDVEDEIMRRLEVFQIAESRLMNEALAAGISKTMIAAQVGTSNWTTLSEKYALTAHEFTSEKVAEREEHARGPQFVHDAWEGRVVVKWWETADGTLWEQDAILGERSVEHWGWPFMVNYTDRTDFERFLKADFEAVTGYDWEDWQDTGGHLRDPDNTSESVRLQNAVAQWWKEQGK